MEEVENVTTAARVSDAGRAHARNLSSELLGEMLRALGHIREALLLHALSSHCPAVAVWGARVVASPDPDAPSIGVAH